jgi:hypothetical protein
MAWAEAVRIEAAARQQGQPEEEQHPCAVPQSGQGSDMTVTGIRRMTRTASRTGMRVAECLATKSFYCRTRDGQGAFSLSRFPAESAQR